MNAGTAKRLLLVDDNLTSIRLLENVLSDRRRYEIVGRAANGAEAIRMFQAHKPDVVLLDIVMPVMDGLQALRMIMQLNPQAKVVMVSSVAGVGDNANEALRLGARGLVSKPCKPDEIHKLLESI